MSSYVNSDVVVDGFSQGAQPLYTFDSLSNNHTIIAVFQSGSEVFVGQAAGDEQIYTASVPPMVLMVMGKDHKLFYEAYNDASDLNGDGALDVGYNPAIDYYGYFDSYKVYKYDGTNNRFYPVRVTTTKKVDPMATDEWSGDFLNYLTHVQDRCSEKGPLWGLPPRGYSHGNRPHEVLHPSGRPCLGQGIRKHYKGRLRYPGVYAS